MYVYVCICEYTCLMPYIYFIYAFEGGDFIPCKTNSASTRLFLIVEFFKY